MADTPKWYDAHLSHFQEVAYINDRETYDKLYTESIETPEKFWAEQAEAYLSWEKKWDSVLDYDFEEGKIAWFSGGTLNACHNCLDRHLEKIGEKTAYYWEGDDPADVRSITYQDLYEQVNRMAALLKAKGVQKGDRVVVYMPVIIQLPVTMLACAIGT